MLPCTLADRHDIAEVLEPARSLEAALKGASKAAASTGVARSKAQQSGSVRSRSAALPECEQPTPAAARAINVDEHASHPTGTGSSSAAEPTQVRTAEADCTAAPSGDAPACSSAEPAPAQVMPAAGGPDVPEELVCPLTNELMKDPVLAADGCAYERSAIEVWFELGNTSFPGGHIRISHTRLTPHDTLRAKIAAWKGQNGA